ncbi:hydrogenase expression/formation protein HupK [uncultured Tateyamaria sp.]|uniref:hydrogenase expression/formation protein HupK n=1 Tax=uncultured Tateyamaria sp. TaxID=455651 RepID=UPI0026234F15|nr:hydrogenase expression/formation protein HupK [uncultured Tateyamaria sp.]
MPLPIAELVLGKPVEEAAELLPRLFNLCRVAQGVAARAAFGLPQEPGWRQALRYEILKEHVLKLCLKWPGQLSVPPLALPIGWMQDAPALRDALFGPGQRMPTSIDAFMAFLDSGTGIGPVLKAIAQVIPPASAVRADLPLTTSNSIFDRMAQENSVAGRHAVHSVMIAIETRWGRGPLWSATGLTCDLADCLEGKLPTADLRQGRSVVPAARGLYGICAQLTNGRITQFQRITPTDHLVMRGGMLEHSLATLEPARANALAPVVLSILDPCFPIRLERDQVEEVTHA